MHCGNVLWKNSFKVNFFLQNPLYITALLMNIDYVLIKWILQAVVLNRPLNDDKLPHAQHPLNRVHLHNYLKHNLNTYWYFTLVLVG